MQKTNFPYICIVVDDASIDGTASMIRRYIKEHFEVTSTQAIPENLGEFVLARHKLNKFCELAYVELSRNLYREMPRKLSLIQKWRDASRYEALCEGDDYWIDPLKLQKQVDILEADETLMAVCSNRRLVNMNGQTLEERTKSMLPDKSSCRITLREYFDYNTIYPTASVLYRNAHTDEVREKIMHMSNQYLSDWTMWIALHCFGDFYYIDEPLTAYRINPTSVTHTQWVKDRVGRVKLEFDLLPRVADVLPAEYADIAARLRNTDWAWFPLAKAYYKSHHYLKAMWALLIFGIKCPKQLVHKVHTFMKKRF